MVATMSEYTDKEQTFIDIRGHLLCILDEEFNIKEEDTMKWDALVKTNPLPPVNIAYVSFIHPEAGKDE
jgi:hypothetical protein